MLIQNIAKALLNRKLLNYSKIYRHVRFAPDACHVHLINHIRSNNAKGTLADMITLYLQKAFVTIGHKNLTNKSIKFEPCF